MTAFFPMTFHDCGNPGSMKSEADIVEVTVMEVFREEKSVRRVHAGSKSFSGRLLILWQEYQNQQRSGLSLV